MAQTGTGVVFSPTAPGFFQTRDFGRSWKQAEGATLPQASHLVLHDSGFGIAADRASLVLTQDFGASWRTGPTVNRVTSADVLANGVGCVGCEGGLLLLTENRGIDWRTVRLDIDGVPVRACGSAAARSYLLLAAVLPDSRVPLATVRERAYGVWLSRQSHVPVIDEEEARDPAGWDWVRAERLLSGRSILLRSDDGWRSWHFDLELWDVRLVWVDARDNLLLLLGTDGRVWGRASDDGGWSVLPAPEIPRGVVRNFDDPYGDWLEPMGGAASARLNAASESTWFRNVPYHARTRDAGRSWVPLGMLPSGLNGGPRPVFLDDRRGFVVGGNYGGTFSVAETTDGGDNWELIHAYDQLEWRFSPIHRPSRQAESGDVGETAHLATGDRT
jgi:hypothetical protein